MPQSTPSTFLLFNIDADLSFQVSTMRHGLSYDIRFSRQNSAGYETTSLKRSGLIVDSGDADFEQ